MRIKTIILSGFVLCLAILSSCKKDNGGSQGAPMISKVTTSLDHTDEIASGALNQWVIIHGINLSGTQKVVFDDLEVGYEDIYSTDTLVSVRIPRRVPTQSTNTLTVFTPAGSATYEFTIEYPDLVFTRLKNEYVAPGDTLEIEGDNFDLYFEQENTTVQFAGGVTVNLAELTPTALRVVVPAGAEPGPLYVKGGEPLNSEINTGNTWYSDNRNFILLDPVLVPATGLEVASPDFPENPGPMLIKNDFYTEWGWDVFLSSYIDFPTAAAANPAGYVLKFEMNTKAPVISGDIIFRLGNNNYYRWPYNFYGTMINTRNEWETMAIPLNFIALDPSDHAYMQLILSDGSSRQNNYAMCNFRIVPK